MSRIDLNEHIEFSEESYVSKVLYDCDLARVVLFCLEKGQEILPHALKSQVVMQVISGNGRVTIGHQTYPVTPDSLAVCENMETYGVKADEQMVILVSIIPLPEGNET